MVDRQRYEQRLDLKLCGRTLFGASRQDPELDDHYCGRIRIRISDFMHEVDRRLWELGVPAKSEHNEAAPAQHELASVFDIANVDCRPQPAGDGSTAGGCQGKGSGLPAA